MVERIALVTLCLAAGCGNPAQTTGELGGHCYPNGTCNVGLSCTGGACYAADAQGPLDAPLDGLPDAPPDALPDAAPDAGFTCNNDFAFEPNETIQNAFATSVQTTQKSVTYNNLAICPNGDKDYFAVSITTANQNLEALLIDSAGDPLSMSIVGGGGATLNAAISSQRLTVAFNTTAVGGVYSPANCVVVWIESGGAFVKTIGRWCDVRKQNLVAWTAKAGGNDPDAISGATRADHSVRLTASWDLKNNLNATVPDGIYTIRMETTDTLATAAAQNNQGTFTFNKGPSDQLQTGLSSGGHSNVNVTYNASRSLRAYVANLPVGNYFVVVSSATMPAQNNYQLTLNTGP